MSSAENRHLTILLIGETGVGKSTLINSFANYAQHQDFNSALKNPICLIPSKVRWTDRNGVERWVQKGKNNIDDYPEVGQAVTQNCCRYDLQVGPCQLTLIDTPGIGNPRGIIQDSSNIINIVNFASQFKELNGIGIIMKAGCTRLTPMFAYCVKALLSFLDRSACANIFFVFTYSRSSSFKPGDSLPALQVVLSEIRKLGGNVVCEKYNRFVMDNESFPAMIAVQGGVEVDPADLKLVEKSWHCSSLSIENIVAYVSKLTPHLIEKTVLINDIRSLVKALTQPLIDFSLNFARNLALLQKYSSELHLCKEEFDRLKNLPPLQVISLSHRKLPEPWFVCESNKCTRYKQLAGVSVRDFSKKCTSRHAIGNLLFNIFSAKGIELVGTCLDVALSKNVVKAVDKCQDVANGLVYVVDNCPDCGCSLRLHKFIDSEPIEQLQRISSQPQHLQVLGNSVNRSKEHLELVNSKIETLEQSMKTLSNCTALLQHYLERHSLLAVSSPYVLRLENEISACQGLVGTGAAQKDMLGVLKKQLESYHQDYSSIKTKVESGEMEVSADKVKEAVQLLLQLKTVQGESFEDCFNQLSINLCI